MVLKINGKRMAAISAIIVVLAIIAAVCIGAFHKKDRKMFAENPSVITSAYSGTDRYMLEIIGNMLCYWDVEASVTVPVCTNPDCSHERSADNVSSCTARLPNEQNFICAFYYDNELYIFAASGLNGFVVYKSDYDGNNRKTIYTDDTYSLVNTDNMCLYNDRLIFNGSVEVYDESAEKLDSKAKILSFDLKEHTVEQLADFSEDEKCYFNNFGICGDSLVFGRSYFDKDKGENNSVVERLDISSKKITKLFAAECIYDQSDGRVYYSEKSGADPTVYCYDGESGKSEKLFEVKGYADNVQATGDKVYYGVCTSKDTIFDESNVYTVYCYDRGTKETEKMKPLPKSETLQLSEVVGDLVMFYATDLSDYTGCYGGIMADDLFKGDYDKLYLSKVEDIQSTGNDSAISDNDNSELAVDENGFVSFDVEADSENYDEVYKDKIKLVYLTDYATMGNTDSEYIQNQVNKYLDSKGCDFVVEFKNNNEYGTGETDEDGNEIMYPNISVYEKMLDKNEPVDILCTGAGMDKDFYANGYMDTFNVCVEKGYLEPLDEYFKTELGKKLYEQFPENYWSVTTSTDGKIYGLSKMYCGAYPSGLIFTNSNVEKYIDGDIESIYDLDEAMRKCSADTGLEALIMPSAGGYETLAGLINFEGIYFSPEQDKFINIFDDENCKRYFEQIESWKNDGLITSSDMQLQSDNALGMISQSNPMVQDGICLGQGYINSRNVNMGVGISSNSQHKKEAFELLAMLNTDEKLADLLCLGKEGRNYVMIDGKPVINSKARAYYDWMDTMANPLLCRLYSANSDKCVQQCESAKLSPLNGFGADLSDISAKLGEIKAINESYYGLFYGDYGEYGGLDEAVEAAKGELEKVGVDEVLAELNKMYSAY